MKKNLIKSIILPFSIILPLLFCSCRQQEKIPEINPCINHECTIEYAGMKYECSITYLTEGTDILTINSPKNLKGLTFRHADGKYSLSYGSLICKSNDLLLPQKSFPNSVMGILSELCKDKSKLKLENHTDTDYTFSGKSKYGSYNITSDPEGKITKISISL